MAKERKLSKSELAKLAADANLHAARSATFANQSLDAAFDAGDTLHKAKAQIEHGDFRKWMKANLDFSERTAQVFMRLAARRTEIEAYAKAQSPALLTVESALQVIAQPKRKSNTASTLPRSASRKATKLTIGENEAIDPAGFGNDVEDDGEEIEPIANNGDTEESDGETEESDANGNDSDNDIDQRGQLLRAALGHEPTADDIWLYEHICSDAAFDQFVARVQESSLSAAQTILRRDKKLAKKFTVGQIAKLVVIGLLTSAAHSVANDSLVVTADATPSECAAQRRGVNLPNQRSAGADDEEDEEELDERDALECDENIADDSNEEGNAEYDEEGEENDGVRSANPIFNLLA